MSSRGAGKSTANTAKKKKGKVKVMTEDDIAFKKAQSDKAKAEKAVGANLAAGAKLGAGIKKSAGAKKSAVDAGKLDDGGGGNVTMASSVAKDERAKAAHKASLAGKTKAAEAKLATAVAKKKLNDEAAAKVAAEEALAAEKEAAKAAAGAAGNAGAGKGIIKMVKPELETMLKKWGKQITVTKGTPLPLAVQRLIPQPEQAAVWDVHEICIRFTIVGPSIVPADGNVKVDCPNGERLPAVLCEAIAAGVTMKWKSMLRHPKAKGKGWLLDKMLTWVEKEYPTLLRLLPDLIETYSMEGEGGDSTRRFNITTPKEEEDPEEKELRELQMALDNAKWLEIAAEKEDLAVAKKMRDGEEKRLQAEAGVFMDGEKVVQLSKKDKALNAGEKRGQGDRTAKTGSRKKKFEIDKEGLKNMPGYDAKGNKIVKKK